MDLVGQEINVKVFEPWERSGDDIKGIVVAQPSEKEMVVKLSQSIKGNKLSSPLIKLNIRYENLTFDELKNDSPLTVNGALIIENSDEFDFIIIGELSIVNLRQ